MSILLPPGPHPEVGELPDAARASALEAMVDRLAERQQLGRIGYWAAYVDDHGVSHYSFTTDPAYAEISAENAASRASAVDAYGRAVERYRDALGALPNARHGAKTETPTRAE
jgi:hypothetical protein